eukprot:1181055-Rhodomonas_salina.1
MPRVLAASYPCSLTRTLRPSLIPPYSILSLSLTCPAYPRPQTRTLPASVSTAAWQWPAGTSIP